MHRRSFLAMLAMLTVGCKSKPDGKATPLGDATALSTPTATPGSPSGPATGTLLATLLLGRHYSFDQPRELSIWKLFDDGRAEQIAVLPKEERIPVPHSGPGNLLVYNVGNPATAVRTALIGLDGSLKVTSERQVPKGESPIFPLGYLVAHDLLLAQKTGKKSEIVTVDAAGNQKTYDCGFGGGIRNSGFSANYVGVGNLGGSLRFSPTVLTIFRVDKGGLSRVVNWDITELTGDGYAGDTTFWEREGELLISTAWQDSAKYGDVALICRPKAGKMEIVQPLEADLFRPPPMTFINSELGYLQDNAGNLFTFVKKGATWSVAANAQLKALGAYVRSNAPGSVLVTKNNPGDILAFKLTPDGKLSSEIAFPELRDSVEGRKPSRIQHDVVAILD